MLIDAFTEPRGPVEHDADLGTAHLQVVDTHLGVIHPIPHLPQHDVAITLGGEDHARLLLVCIFGLPNPVEPQGLVLLTTLGDRLDLDGRNATLVVEKPDHFAALIFVFPIEDGIPHAKFSGPVKCSNFLNRNTHAASTGLL